MSTSSNEIARKADRLIQGCVLPDWLESFVQRTFFHGCPFHGYQEPDANRYCITCDAFSCKVCVEAGRHEYHDVVTIYRHVYQDVVLLSQLEKYVDSRGIQPYRCNGMWVLSLTPLPHNGSGRFLKNKACYVCMRKLTNPDRFCFCSIRCKVQACEAARMNRDPAPGGYTALRMSAENGNGSGKRRKGVAHRAAS